MKKKRGSIKHWGKKNLPTILTWTSAISTVGALYFTGKATVKAVRTYDELKKENKDISKKEILKAVGPYYIPAAGFAAASVACSFSSNHINLKRQQILAGALFASNEALQAFRKKVTEKIGEDEVKQITKEQAQEAPLVESKRHIPGEKVVVYDDFLQYKFETTFEKLNDAEFEVNRRLNNNDCYICTGNVPYEEFYRWMDVRPPKTAYAYSWNSSDMWDLYNTAWVDFYQVDTVDSDGRRMIILRYNFEPMMKSILKIEEREIKL